MKNDHITTEQLEGEYSLFLKNEMLEFDKRTEELEGEYYDFIADQEFGLWEQCYHQHHLFVETFGAEELKKLWEEGRYHSGLDDEYLDWN
jgi:hypothetical protein